MKSKAHKILDCKLIKVEKLYNQVKPSKLFYNLILEGMEEPLLIETEHNTARPNRSKDKIQTERV